MPIELVYFAFVVGACMRACLVSELVVVLLVAAPLLIMKFLQDDIESK